MYMYMNVCKKIPIDIHVNNIFEMNSHIFTKTYMYVINFTTFTLYMMLNSAMKQSLLKEACDTHTNPIKTEKNVRRPKLHEVLINAI